MTENFLNLGKETDTQVQEAQSSKQDELRHIIIKMPKLKTES